MQDDWTSKTLGVSRRIRHNDNRTHQLCELQLVSLVSHGRSVSSRYQRSVAWSTPRRRHGGSVTMLPTTWLLCLCCEQSFSASSKAGLIDRCQRKRNKYSAAPTGVLPSSPSWCRLRCKCLVSGSITPSPAASLPPPESSPLSQGWRDQGRGMFCYHVRGLPVWLSQERQAP